MVRLSRPPSAAFLQCRQGKSRFPAHRLRDSDLPWQSKTSLIQLNISVSTRNIFHRVRNIHLQRPMTKDRVHVKEAGWCFFETPYLNFNQELLLFTRVFSTSPSPLVYLFEAAFTFAERDAGTRIRARPTLLPTACRAPMVILAAEVSPEQCFLQQERRTGKQDFRRAPTGL